MLPVRKAFERTDGIITDGRYTESLLPDRVQMLFQLDELDLAEGSPIRRAEEHEHCAVWARNGFQSLAPAFLVLSGKSGYLLAYVWPGLDVLAVQRRNWKRPHGHFDEISLCRTISSLLRT